MTINEFIDSSLKWNELVNPDKSIEDQLAICTAEWGEFEEASNLLQKTLEAVDCIWVYAFMQKIYERGGNFLASDKYRRQIWELRHFHDAEAFKACSESNYSKLLYTKEVVIEEVRQASKNPRYKNVTYKQNGRAYWLVGDDHQDPENVQTGKLLKPYCYMSKESLYLGLPFS